MARFLSLTVLVGVLLGLPSPAGQLIAAPADPVRTTKGMVVSVSTIASDVGAAVLRDGGNAIDAAVATAFALAVTYPQAGNIGGGGFLMYRPASGSAIAYDFRETAPAGASPTMFLEGGRYNPDLHHRSSVSVGVPGTVAGLHLAWSEHGALPWKRLVGPAIELARDGFQVPVEVARSLRGVLDDMRPFPASLAQFSKNGVPYEPGDVLKQPDLAETLSRIADSGPAGFYAGETAELIADDMGRHGGLITKDDLAAYRAKARPPIRTTYRGYDVISMPLPSSGGVVLAEMLNVLEGFDLTANGFGSAANAHLIAETMRRAYADRAQYLGDSDFYVPIPVDRLTSKAYSDAVRKTIDPERASVSSPTVFTWVPESPQTTHVSVVDEARNAVALTYTLEYSYGSRSVVPGAGFLLNNEMGDFNPGPGLTDERGLIGTLPNLAAPGKRMLSSMTPTIVSRDGRLVMVTGTPGSRTIINTVLLTILNVVDFGMNAQEAVDAGRFHHQWLPDRITYEPFTFSPDTLTLLRARGHVLVEGGSQGIAEVIVANDDSQTIEAGVDRRQTGGSVAVQ